MIMNEDWGLNSPRTIQIPYLKDIRRTGNGRSLSWEQGNRGTYIDVFSVFMSLCIL